MITIMQGSSKKLTITLKSDQLVVQDPDECFNIMMELYHENGNKMLALYGTDEAEMNALGLDYDLAYIDGNTIIFWVDSARTINFPPGRIIAKFTIEYTDVNFPITGKQVIKAKGALFNVTT